MLRFLSILWFWPALLFGQVTVKQGVIDLRAWDREAQPQVNMGGEWEFYWNQLYEPQDFAGSRATQPELFSVPGSWSLRNKLPENGKATFRLHVITDSLEPLAFRTPWIFSAARVFADGQLLGELGSVGQVGEWANYSAFVREEFWIVQPKNHEFDIIIQVASTELYLTGMMSSPHIGTPRSVHQWVLKETGKTLLLVGAILIMGLYHLVLFSLRPAARSSLAFGLTCLGVGLYMASARPFVVAAFAPNVPFLNLLRFYNIWIVVSPCLMWFVYFLYPDLFSRRVAKASTVVGVIMYLDTLFVPLHHMLIKIFGYQIFFLIVNSYSMVVVVRALRQKKDGARLYLAGVTVITVTAVHDMLRMILDSEPWMSYGLCFFIFCQSTLLARRFSQAFKKVESSEREIRHLSEDLRRERDQVLVLVDDKTRDIVSIMSHIQLGIFAITRENFAIHKDYSQFLSALFERKDLAEQNAVELLYAGSDWSGDDKNQLENALAASLGEARLAFDLNAGILPRSMKRQRQDGTLCFLDLSWNPMENAKGIVDKILVTVRDMTELRVLEENAAFRQEELQFISDLLNISALEFRRFSQSSMQMIEENRRILQTQTGLVCAASDLKALFVNLHTMKGMARSLFLKRMTAVIHDAEQTFARGHVADLRRDLEAIASQLKVYEAINSQKLNRKQSGELALELPESKLLSVYGQTGQIPAVQAILFPFLFTPLQNVLTDIFRSAETLAKDLGKANPRVLIQGVNPGLSSSTDELVRRVFVHLLRNAMDHGIESAAVREKLGKPEAGTLEITVVQDLEEVCMRLTDDGAGLDLEEILKAARSRGMVGSEKLSKEQIADLIFQTGLSTRGVVNEISGRGVGMDAVRQYVEKAGGRVFLDLKDEPDPRTQRYGFTIELRLPRSMFAFPYAYSSSSVA